MRIGIPREIRKGERRVAATPDVALEIQKLGFSVAVETGAGLDANFDDSAYRGAGAEVVTDREALWTRSDIIIKVRAPEGDEVELIRSDQVLISFLWPAQNPKLLDDLAAKGVTALAMDSLPRISRAQKMDALSSMANIAGYRAVLEAACAARHLNLSAHGVAIARLDPAIVPLVRRVYVKSADAIEALRDSGVPAALFDLDVAQRRAQSRVDTAAWPTRDRRRLRRLAASGFVRFSAAELGLYRC